MNGISYQIRDQQTRHLLICGWTEPALCSCCHLAYSLPFLPVSWLCLRTFLRFYLPESRGSWLLRGLQHTSKQCRPSGRSWASDPGSVCRQMNWKQCLWDFLQSWHPTGYKQLRCDQEGTVKKTRDRRECLQPPVGGRTVSFDYEVVCGFGLSRMVHSTAGQVGGFIQAC